MLPLNIKTRTTLANIFVNGRKYKTESFLGLNLKLGYCSDIKVI